MPTFPPPQASEMQQIPTVDSKNIDLEGQPIAQPEATHNQHRKRLSQSSSQTASQTTSSKSSKSLGRWEKYQPGNFKPLCSHGVDKDKCTQCGSGKRQKKLFWLASVLCAVGLIATFVVVAVIESDHNGAAGKP